MISSIDVHSNEAGPSCTCSTSSKHFLIASIEQHHRIGKTRWTDKQRPCTESIRCNDGPERSPEPAQRRRGSVGRFATDNSCLRSVAHSPSSGTKENNRRRINPSYNNL
uniref:Uncharacterized protein n=1 Tax=Steinernema glaseri TaxID=37863 RepID=A0A1I7ZLX9_9BILA